MKCSNIWFKQFSKDTSNCEIGGNKIQGASWRSESIPLPQSQIYVNINCGTDTVIWTALKLID